MLGWFHSHPVREWCKKCPLEDQRRCRMAHDFFSPQDVLLHRTMFSPAFNVALVVNDVAFSDPTFSLFGWRHGLVQPRGFALISEHAPVPVGEPRRDVDDEATTKIHERSSR